MQSSRIHLCAQGPELSRFVMGYWRLADWPLRGPALLDFIKRGLDLGLTAIDHADIYGDYRCEEIFGQALRLEPALRQHLELITKCGICLCSPARPAHRVKHYDTSREHIVRQAERSLHNLGTDYLDLLLIHRPDPLMHADEVAEAFILLRRQGKVRHVGVSNFLPHQFELLQSRLDIPLVTNQVEISPLHLQPLHDGTLDLCQQRRIAPMAWSCLGGGRLMTGEDPKAQRLRHVLGEIGAELGGASIDRVALAWLLQLPSRPVPVLGTGRIERIESAIGAEQIHLDRQQWFRILEASAGHEVP